MVYSYIGLKHLFMFLLWGKKEKHWALKTYFLLSESPSFMIVQMLSTNYQSHTSKQIKELDLCEARVQPSSRRNHPISQWSTQLHLNCPPHQTAVETIGFNEGWRNYNALLICVANQYALKVLSWLPFHPYQMFSHDSYFPHCWHWNVQTSRSFILEFSTFSSPNEQSTQETKRHQHAKPIWKSKIFVFLFMPHCHKTLKAAHWNSKFPLHWTAERQAVQINCQRNHKSSSICNTTYVNPWAQSHRTNYSIETKILFFSMNSSSIDSQWIPSKLRVINRLATPSINIGFNSIRTNFFSHHS